MEAVTLVQGYAWCLWEGFPKAEPCLASGEFNPCAYEVLCA